MNNTLDKAILEFRILRSTVEDTVLMPFEEEILALVGKFGESGQSGCSAPYTADIISQTVKDLCLQNPICGITGIDLEWNKVSDGSDNQEMYQNKRLSSVFKEGKDGNPYYLNAIVFRGEDNIHFTGNSVKLKDGSTLKSRQFINLPFKPKSFYIDVIETEWADKNESTRKEGGGWWTSVVKDETQLKEVFEYYNK